MNSPELDESRVTDAPFSASANPSQVSALTPEAGDAATVRRAGYYQSITGTIVQLLSVHAFGVMA